MRRNATDKIVQRTTPKGLNYTLRIWAGNHDFVVETVIYFREELEMYSHS